MDPKLLELINLGFLITFVVLIFLAVGRIGYRFYQYKKEALPIPDLLVRDFLLFAGLGVPFLGSLILRFTNIIAREQVWYPAWIITTGIIAISGVAYFVYYEYFKIEK